MSIEVVPLGAGQDVGRSCIIIKILDKTIMLDCGLHMGFNDNRKYPDFSFLNKEGESYDRIIDLVLITHFHLDHCGALPYFTEICGYKGLVIMTTPTRAMVPYMLEDFRKVMVDTRNTQAREAETSDVPTYLKESSTSTSSNAILYTFEHIHECLKKIQVIQLHETIEYQGMKIKAFYAGHVLGACMFSIEYCGHKVVYTGDFNSSADRHLGAAWIEKLKPDLLITETTYATVLRDSKRSREREFLKQVQETLDNGGKVLIPVFALGRAQELCILLETYWSRTKNTYPIYFAAGLIDKANFYYKLFVNWTNEKIQSSFVKNNMFDFKYISSFDKNLIKSPMPMVLFATPGMLHGGLSLQVFKEWCSEPKNTLIIPGYCVAGTFGNKLLSGVKSIMIDKKQYNIKMAVKNMSFSAHADAKGILQLIKHLQPENLMLVHGEKSRMKIFSEVVKDHFQIPCFWPANHEKFLIKTNKPQMFSLEISPKIAVHEAAALMIVNEKKGLCKLFPEEDFLEELNLLISMLNEKMAAYAHEQHEGMCFSLKPDLGMKFLNTTTKNIDYTLLKNYLIKVFDCEIRKLGVETEELEKIKKKYDIEIEGESIMVKLLKPEKPKEKEIIWRSLEALKQFCTSSKSE